MQVYLDIETIPSQNPAVLAKIKQEAENEIAQIKAPANYKDEAKIAEYVAAKADQIRAEIDTVYRKTALDGAQGSICCIVVAFGNSEPVIISEVDESVILHHFYNVMISYCDPHNAQFVGHNIVNFDLRYIYQRSIIQGIKHYAGIPFHAKPWDDHRVFDTMTRWAGVGNRISLSKLCDALGVAGKGSELGEDMDGSKVWDLYKAKRYADIATYCAGDVERVRAIYKKMNFL